MKKRMEKERDNPETLRIHARILAQPMPGMAIVKSVFPEGFIRSLAVPTMESALRRRMSEIASRHATTEAAYAVVPMRYILEGDNEYGEVAP